ncbi:MAG: GNAT family N-acetyltransferase [Aeromonas veronii]
MELKFLSVNLNTVNQVLSEKQIAKVIELQNNLIKWEIENKKFLCDQETLSPLSMDINGLLRHESQVLYVAMNPTNNLPVAITVAEPHPENPLICGLMSVCVEPMYKREGIGSQLMSKIKEDLSNNGFKEIVLFLDFRSPEALGFYTSLGFQLTFANASLGI